MKPPAKDDLDPGTRAAPLGELSLAFRSGRLVELLKGDGLDRSTVEELLSPESLEVLKTILDDHLFSGSGPADGSDRRGATQEESEVDRATVSGRWFRAGER